MKRALLLLYSLLLGLLCTYDFAFGQKLYPPNISTDGTVQTLAQDGNTMYVGGNFSTAGYYTGRSALLSTSSDIPNFDFPVINGSINAAISDGAGGWYIGGSFTQVGTVDRRYLAHILADKTVDANWNPEPNNQVLSLALSGNVLYVGGYFTEVAEQERRYLAALNKADGTATSWNPNPNSTISSIVINGQTVYIGGSFTEIAGKSQRYFASLDATTAAAKQTISVNSTVQTLAQDGNTMYVGGNFSTAGYYTGRSALLSTSSDIPNFDFPVINGSINAAISDGAGGWYIGGSFTQVGTVDRRYLAHILADKTVDANWNPEPNNQVLSLALSGNVLYVGGYFTEVAEQERRYLAALNKADGTATSWNPNPNSYVWTIAVNGSTVYAGGQFTEIAGKSQRYFASLDATTAAAKQTISVNSTVQTLAQDGNTMYVGGNFSTAGYYTGRSALLSTSSDIPNFDFPVINGSINAAISDGAGGWYIGGSFTQVGTVDRRYLAHILADKTVDANWNPEPNNQVLSLALSGNVLYVGGYFTEVAEQERRYLAALNKADGTATSWNPNPNSTISSIVINGQTVYIGGSFTEIAGKSQRYFASLDATTAAAKQTISVNSTVQTLAQDGNTMYVGGNFSTAGYYTGRSALLSTSSDIPNFDFPVINGSINAAISDGAGGWYIGGSFTQVGTVDRRYLAHILADKTVDANWNPEPNNQVLSLALSGNVLYVGGYFTEVAEQERRYLAALNKADGTATSWNPNPNSYVWTIAVNGSTVYVGGSFTQITGLERKYFAAFNTMNGSLNGWNPQFNSQVNYITFDGSTMYIGGNFSNINGTNRNYIASFNTTNQQLTTFDPKPNSTVQSIAIGNNAIYLGGSFSYIGNQQRSYLAAVSKTDGSLTDWNPAVNSTVQTLTLSGTTLYAGGNFTKVGEVDRNYLAAFNATDGSLAAWNPQPSGSVETLVITGNNIFIGGNFDYLKSADRGRVLAFNTATNQVSSWRPQPNSTVQSIAIGSDVIYLGGSFSYIGNQQRSYLAAVGKTDGSLTDWNPAVNSTVQTLTLSGTTLYAGGNFTKVGEVDRNYLAAFNATDGSLAAWNPQPSGSVETLVITGNNIFIGGNFDYLKSADRGRVLAFNTATNQVSSWRPQPNSTVQSIAIGSDVIYLGGSFSYIGNQQRSYLAAVSKTDGSLTDWNPAVNSTVQTLTLSGTTLYAGGNFTKVGEVDRNYLAAFNATDGSLAAWNPQPSGSVETLVITGNNILLGGNFDYFKSVDKRSLLSLNTLTNQIASWDLDINYYYYNTINDIAVSGNLLYIGGNFTQIAGQERKYIAAINKTDGSLTDWNPALNNIVNSIDVTGSTVFVGGSFTQVDDQIRHNIASFTISTGDLTSWNPQPDGYDVSLIKTNGSEVFVGGSFNFLKAEKRSGLLAIDLSTKQLTSWNPNPTYNNSSTYINKIVVSGNTVYVGGRFTNVGGQQRSNLAALNKSDGLATGWSPNPNDVINQITVDAQAIYVSGNFTSIGGEQRNKLAALNKTDGKATTWNPNPNAYYSYQSVSSIATDNNYIYVGGSFSNIAGQARNYLASFNKTDGSLTDWNPNPNSLVQTMEIDTNTIYVNGYFSNIAGQARRGLASFNRANGTITTWNPGITGIVYDMGFYKKNIILGGSISKVNNLDVKNLAVVNKDSGKVIEWYPAINSTIQTLSYSNDTIYIGGSFSEIDNTVRRYLATFQAPPDTASRINQTITFKDISNKVYNDQAFSLEATASSKLPVRFTIVEGSAYAQIINDNLVFIRGVGTVKIKASQSGNINYNAAPDVEKSFCISPIQPSTIFGLAKICISKENYSVTNVPGATYNWSVSGGGIIIASGNTASIEWNKGGKHTITVTYTSNCSSTPGPARTLEVEVVDTPLAGTIANMLPADGNSNVSLPLTFSWFPVDSADTYDLYIWPDSAAKPTTPFITGISGISYTIYNGLLYEKLYKWQIVAKKACYQLAGPIQTFRLRYLPDLIVENIQIPVSGFSGRPFSVKWNVKNTGDGSTLNQQWYDAVYLSKDGILDREEDFYLGAVSNVSSLETNKSYSQTATFNLPQGIDDNYYVFVVTNLYQNLLESSTSNNETISTSTTSIDLTPPPDLQVVSIVRPSVAFSGQQINVSWIIKNEGPGSTILPSWTDYIYFSNDSIFGSGNATLIGSARHNKILEPEKSDTLTSTLTLPQGIFGNYYIYIQTDASSEIFEHAFENNNSLRSGSIDVRLTPPVDLIVTQISVPEKGSNNETLQIKWSVENQGGSSTQGYSWIDNIYLSKLSAFNPDSSRLVGQLAKSVILDPGESYEAQYNIAIPDKITGNYYVFVLTDATDRVFEYTNENNNTLRNDTILRIVSPDLSISNITIPVVDTAGNVIELQWVVKNVGEGSLYNTSQIVDRISISSSPVYNATTDEQLKRVSYIPGTLLPKEDTVKKETVRLPNGLSGTYYIHVVTDYLDNIYESNKSNNRKVSTALKVVLGPWADLQVSNVQVQSTGKAGELVNLQFSVINKGAIATKVASWTDRIFISTEGEFNEASAIFIRDIQREAILKKDSSYQVNTTISLPLNIGGENYYVYVLTDADNNIYEHTSENNNTRKSNAIAVEAYPPVDLAVVSVSGPVSGTSGKPIKIQWEVENIGAATTLPAHWYDAVYLSADTVWNKSQDILVSEWKQIGSTLPGKSYTNQQNVFLPNGVSGTYYLLIVADHLDFNQDKNRQNNYQSINGEDNKPIDIEIELTPPSDLVISSFTAPLEGVAGQPITLQWTTKNQGIGSSIANAWTDKIYLSRDLVVGGDDIEVGTYVRNGILSPGASYTDSLQVFLPISAADNYILIIKTDFANAVYEHQAEENNTKTRAITVIKPPLSDLVVSSITNPATALAGGTVNIEWKVKNIGANPASGVMQEAVYLSADTIKGVDDILLGTKTSYISLAPQMEETQSLTSEINGASLKNYHVLVYTDILNNMFESNDTNNITPSRQKMQVTLPDLPINVLTKASLLNNKTLYYKINIPDSLISETLLITLKGDSINGNNEIYLRYEEVPTRAVHDFAYNLAFSGNQEILVPELKKGNYYLMVYGNKTTTELQNISLLATILKFGIRSVHAKTGGNTGPVTIAVNGSKLGTVTNIRLVGNGKNIEADSVKIFDPTKLFATFNLDGATLGDYHVVAENVAGDTTTLTKGFKIVTGTAPNLLTSVVTPPSTRPNGVVSISVQFTNAGNTDLINPVLELSSMAGAPIGFALPDLANNSQQLTISLQEANGPSGILRPGASGTVIIYSKASTALSFALFQPNTK